MLNSSEFQKTTEGERKRSIKDAARNERTGRDAKI